MTTKTIEFTAPVYVTVDLETKQVTEVSVYDEGVEPTGSALIGPDSEATNIALEADEWPQWRFGS